MRVCRHAATFFPLAASYRFCEDQRGRKVKSEGEKTGMERVAGKAATRRAVMGSLNWIA